jgi:sporulation protein YqfD
MVRIDCLIFGYRRIAISPDDLSLATSILIRSSLPSRISTDGCLIIRERDFLKLQALFKGRIEFECSDTLGLYGKIKRLRHKTALICAGIVSLLLLIVSSNTVWDVRIEGNVNIPSADISLRLEECGLAVGDLWSGIDRSDVELKYLDSDERISWININRRGSVAYVSVIEGETDEGGKEEGFRYSNIVASTDCVIEEITVYHGMAMVKPGDVVKKGDVLIVGVLPEGAGGGFCAADGMVVGRINDKISVEVDRKYEKTALKENKIYSISLNFFKKSLNIFKLYGNLTNKCDIIDTEKTYLLFGKCRLPFSVSISYLPSYSSIEAEYTDEELPSVASSRLDGLIAARLCLSDLLRIRTYGEFTEKGYRMWSEMVYLSDVSKQVEFKVE